MKHVNLRVLCEGPTELNFVTRVLRKYLEPVNVHAVGQSLTPGRFGIIGYEKLYHAIKLDVGRFGKNDFVTTMIDLYGLGDYPGITSLPGETPYDRVARIERGMSDGLPSPRFIPYVQLHEFEALVLVDVRKIPTQFPNGVADAAPISLLKTIDGTAPELVNDGKDTHPAKRIIKEIPTYHKPTDGPAITDKIGIERLREACPHFNQWISRLESLSEDG